MRTPDRLPDEALDSLLDGSPSAEAFGTPLAAYLDAVRHEAMTTQSRLSAELAAILAEGLEPAEPAATTAGSTSWRRRGRIALRALTAKFAALGLLGKAAAAGAAVTVATSGAGAAGVLPPPAQTAFDQVVGREAPLDDVSDEGEEDAGRSEPPPETPADTSGTEPLDTNVPDDATGSSDAEPGVDGGDIADDASDGQGDAARDAPDERPDAPEDTPAKDALEDTPADEMPEEAPPTPAPAADRPADDDAPADQGPAGQRPEDPSAAPPTDGGPPSD